MIRKVVEAARFCGSRLILFGSVVLTVWLPTAFLRLFAEEPLAVLQVEGIARLLVPIEIGALLHAVSRLQAGETATYSQSIVAGCRSWGRLLASRFLANVLILLGFLALIVPGVVLAVRYSLLESAVVLEGGGIHTSRKRSVRLTRGMGWQLFGAIVLVGAVALFSALPLIVMGALIEPLAKVAELVGSLIVTTAIAYLTILFFVFYREATADEGEDLEDRARERRAASVPRRVAYAMVLSVAVAFSFVPAFRSALIDWNDVPTGAMKPSIVEGDRIVVHKAAYDLRVPFTRLTIAERAEPARGDIVVFHSPETGDRLVKRVVALPGETIEIRRDGQVVVNGVAATYEDVAPEHVAGMDEGTLAVYDVAYESLGTSRHPVLFARGVPVPPYGPYRVPESSYIVLGDNRSNSRDSRFFGAVERDAIRGRAWAVALSFDPGRAYLPRWSRFLTALP